MLLDLHGDHPVQLNFHGQLSGVRLTEPTGLADFRQRFGEDAVCAVALGRLVVVTLGVAQNILNEVRAIRQVFSVIEDEAVKRQEHRILDSRAVEQELVGI
jgi:hypothetical protein